MKIKILTFILAIFSLLSVFISCDSGSSVEETSEKATEASVGSVTEIQPDSTETFTEIETSDPNIHPDIEKTNYNDDVFMHVYERPKLLWTEEGMGDVFTEALFARQEKLYEYLGVELTATVVQKDGDVQTAIKAKDGSVDILISSPYLSISLLVMDGYIRNFNDFYQINLDADYWKLDYMEELMLGEDIYLGYSNFNIFNTNVISYNKTMLEKYANVLDESLYDSVRNYRWTIDKMISLAKLAYIDQTSDGKTEDDIFGITGRQWIPFIGFLHACDINLVEQDDAGNYLVAVYNEKNKVKTTSLVEKLHDLSKSDCSWFSYKNEGPDRIYLTSNRTLLSIAGTPELVDYLNYDLDFGVLPYPMYDENQKDVGYRSFNYDGFITFPSYMRNENMSVETIEILSFFSEPVQVAYYEKMLGRQVADAPEDSEMLKIVWNGICTDFGLAFSHISGALDNNLYMLPNLTYDRTTDNVTSYVKAYENNANRAISKWMQKYFLSRD